MAEYLTPVGRLARDDRVVTNEPIFADEQPVEVFFDRYPPAIRATGLRLRELISRRRP